MIEWVSAPYVEVRALNNGDHVGFCPEPVGEPDAPEIVGLGIFQDGSGTVIEGTRDELLEFARRIQAKAEEAWA